MTRNALAGSFTNTFLLCALMLSAGCENKDNNPASGHDFGDNDQNLYVAMGDSITEGYLASTAYPAILSGMLGKPVINVSIGGGQSWQGASMVESTLANYKPGFLLIYFGANDMIHSHDQSETIGNLRAMIVAAKANKTIPVIATCTPMMWSHEAFDGSISVLNGMIKDLASSEGAILVDLGGAFKGHPEYLNEDGLHPNDLGQQVIAAEFRDAL